MSKIPLAGPGSPVRLALDVPDVRACPAERLDDAVGDLVAGGDPAEDVDEDAPHGGVGQDDVQPVGHHLGRGAAADVEEVGRLDAAELLTGVGDDVEAVGIAVEERRLPRVAGPMLSGTARLGPCVRRGRRLPTSS